jgi:hypothetical protein
VDEVKVGEFVVLPFTVACGHCKNCERGLPDHCLTAQPVANWAGAAYGFADMAPWPGGQAEMLRVPWGDFNCLRTVNPDKLRMEPVAVAYVRTLVQSGKPVAAIRHGPWNLVEADVARGRRVTSWPSVRTDLRNAGATVVDEVWSPTATSPPAAPPMTCPPSAHASSPSSPRHPSPPARGAAHDLHPRPGRSGCSDVRAVVVLGHRRETAMSGLLSRP